MPKKDRTTQVNAVLAPDVFAALNAYCDATGHGFTHVINRALRRDLANPPPLVPDPPLPPAPPDPAPAKRPGRPRKKSG